MAIKKDEKKMTSFIITVYMFITFFSTLMTI
jgi:hypothetical protein